MNIQAVRTAPRSPWQRPLGELGPLVVIEPQALAGEPGLQQAILFRQERDQIRLFTINPATQDSDLTNLAASLTY